MDQKREEIVVRPAKGPEKYQIDRGLLAASAGVLVAQCHGVAKSCGWWTSLEDGEDMTGRHGNGKSKRNVGELLCLVHSEISEAMEGDRKGKQDDHLPERTSLEVELADAVIRICDLAGGLDLDLAGAIAEKLAYNQMRADHKPAQRREAGGKAY